MKKILLSLLCVGGALISNAQTWTEQVANIPVVNTYIGDISVVSPTVAWGMVQRTGTTAATNYQTYTKTTDGINWTAGAINVGNASGLAIANISAVDANTAWVAVFPTGAGLATQGVYKTVNGGTNWTRQATAAFTSASFVNFVHFWDANNGVCMGDKRLGYYEIYTTIDGGTTWIRTPSANIAPNATDWGYTGKYYVAGNTIWFGTDGGKLMRSTDKGFNWTVIDTPLTDFGGTDPTSIGEFAFRDDNNGVIQETVNEVFYVTNDAGVTWTPTATTGMYWGSIGYAGTMLVSGGSTTGNFGSSYSTNNGANWTGIDTDSHTCLAFKDATTGWGGGFEVVFKFNNALSNDEFADNATFKLYPNPANQSVTLNVSDTDTYRLSVTDVTGKVVMERSLSGIENTLDVSALSSGAYFFTLTTDQNKQTVKIIKN